MDAVDRHVAESLSPSAEELADRPHVARPKTIPLRENIRLGEMTALEGVVAEHPAQRSQFRRTGVGAAAAAKRGARDEVRKLIGGEGQVVNRRIEKRQLRREPLAIPCRRCSLRKGVICLQDEGICRRQRARR